MRRLRALFWRLAGTLGLGRSDSEFADELRSHQDLLAAEYEHAGLAPEAARRRAAIDCAGMSATTEALRDRRGLPWIDGAWRDARVAARSLVRTPVLSLSMVLILGLGIGVATVVAAVFQTVTWADLPVPDAKAVVRLAQDFEGTYDRRVQGETSRFSLPELEAYRQRSTALAAVAGMYPARVTWRREGEAVSLRATRVTGDYFRVLPVIPSLGRLLTAADAREPVAVISHQFWIDAFGGAPDVAGRSMRIDGVAHIIVGVTPPAFIGTEIDSTSLWLPLEGPSAGAVVDNRLKDANLSWLQAIGRLGPDSTIASARAEAATIAPTFDLEYPGRRTSIAVTRASRLDSALDRQALTAGVVAAALLGLLFLLCGSNAAVLLLARGAARQREVAVRVAIGASRGQIARHLLAEVGVIGLASAAVGLIAAMAASRLLATLPPMRDLVADVHLDAGVFGFCLTTALLVALVFGLAPTRQAMQVDCLGQLKAAGAAIGTHRRTQRLRRVFIALQVSVSCVLLIVAAMMGRGVMRLFDAKPGFVVAGLHIVEPDAHWQPERQSADAGALSAALATSLARTPGVGGVARVAMAPFLGSGHSQASSASSGPQPVGWNDIDSRYFEVLGVSPLAGRAFLADDTDAVVVVNAPLARRFFGDERTAIGASLTIPVRGGGAATRTAIIVGVVPTLQTIDVGLDDGPIYYTTLAAESIATASLLVRAQAHVAVAQLASEIGRQVNDDAMVKTTALDARMDARAAPARVALAVVAGLGVLALGIAAVGIYGLIAFTVVSRTREIGVYRALGAAPRQILGLLLHWTLRGAALGAGAAVVLVMAISLAFRDSLRPLLNGLSPLDPASYAIGALVLVGVIALAVYVPARRAFSLAPIEALRRDA